MAEDILTTAFDRIIAQAMRTAIMEMFDDAYLAGIFDGEGSIHRNGRCWRLSVVNAYYRTPERFKERFGGNIQERKKQKPHHKTTWVWFASGHAANCAAEAMLPFLEIKREAIEKAMLDDWVVKEL